MPKIILEEQPDFAVLPDDSILHLKIEDVTVKDVTGRNGDWQKLEFKFKVLGVQATGDGSSIENYESMLGQNIWGSVPFRLTDNPENKLRQWTEAILQIDLGVGFELDTDLFLRREVRGLTSTYDKRNKDPKTGLPFKGHQVESLLAKTGGASPAQAAANPWAQPAQPAAAASAPASPWSEDPPF